MTENSLNTSNQVNKTASIFDKGTTTYFRMIEMIKNITKTKIKPAQTEPEQQKQGTNKNEAIEIEDTPEQQQPSNPKGGNQANNQNEVVFEELCEVQQLQAPQAQIQNEGDDAEVVEQDEVEYVHNQDRVYEQSLEQQEHQQENNQQFQEVLDKQDDQSYQERNVQPKIAKRTVPLRKIIAPKAVKASNIQTKPQHSSRAKIHRVLSKNSPIKPITNRIQSKPESYSSSNKLKQTQPLPKSKKGKFQDIFQQSKISINLEVQQITARQIQAFNSKSINKVNSSTRSTVNERKSQKRIQTKPKDQKMKKPVIEWLDFRVVLPLSILSLPESKQNETKPQKNVPLVKKTTQKQQFTPKMLISKSKEMQAEINSSQKKQSKRQMINLGSYTLVKLVEQVFNLGFISEQLCSQFIQNSSKAFTKDFLSKFQSGSLRKFDFKTIKFTPLDHRRLSQLLVNLFPNQYILDLSSLAQDQSVQFIRSSYGLSPKQYFDIYSQIDKISDISWWSEIIINHKNRIQNMVRGNRAGQIEKNGILKGANRVSAAKFDDLPKKRVKFL